MKESLRNCHSQQAPNEVGNQMECGILDGIIAQEKEIKTKPRKFIGSLIVTHIPSLC
jgi:hypothetical protein